MKILNQTAQVLLVTLIVTLSISFSARATINNPSPQATNGLNASGTAFYVPNWTASGSGLATSSPLFVSSTHIGIGTTNPAALFQIASNGTNPKLYLQDTFSGGKIWSLESGIPGVNDGSFAISNVTDGTRGFTISTSGQVGIFNNAPDRNLSIGGGALGFANGNGNSIWHWTLFNSAKDLDLTESGVADGRFYMKAGGYDGINNTNPINNLDVTGTGDYSISLDVGSSTTASTTLFVNGSMGYSIGSSTVSSTLVATSPHFEIYNNTSTATSTLPSIATSIGADFVFKLRGSGALNIAAAGTDKIFNTSTAQSFTLGGQGSSTELFNDGTYWDVISAR